MSYGSTFNTCNVATVSKCLNLSYRISSDLKYISFSSVDPTDWHRFKVIQTFTYYSWKVRQRQSALPLSYQHSLWATDNLSKTCHSPLTERVSNSADTCPWPPPLGSISISLRCSAHGSGLMSTVLNQWGLFQTMISPETPWIGAEQTP